jgi:TonB family protein
MPENILVVEYEPRYTDRVKQALAGQPFVPAFARDGEEALRALDAGQPKLIVLSSVVPKVSTPELIRVIRGRGPLAQTPILVTVSGYSGKSPKQDAVRMGASDILPKPYSESEFLGKIQQMLGVRPDSGSVKTWAPELDPEFTARPAPPPSRGGEGQLTSNEIFGELLEDDRAASSSGARKPMAKPQDDLDKMLADTLAGVRPQKKRDGAATSAGNVPIPPSAAAPPAAAPRAKTASGGASSASEFDRMLNDTLSGLEPKRAKTSAGNVPAPQPAAPRPAPPPPASPPATARPSGPTTDPKYTTARLPALEANREIPDRVPASQPVFPQAAALAPVEDDEPLDGARFGQYVLVERIATGGMAEVWKARMRGVEGFQKIVAIKKILPHLSDNQDFIEMFIDEAKLAAQLSHNNIIHIYDLGKIQSSYYIAMEYVDGFDLKTILKKAEEKDQPITVELALFIASKIAAALDYAHRKRDFEDRDLRLVHRDVSPQNVLISQEGDIKLCDFGIAKAASKASHTQAGALKGKLQYMSPEQAWGRDIDKRSDIFALATVLFEMLTNRKLFGGDNELSILEQVREARIAPPSQYNDEVTPEIDKIVLKALQKDAGNRYQTAGEMERDINAVLYTFRPTPTSADLAIYMHRLQTSADVVRDEPQSMSHQVPAASAFSNSYNNDPFALTTPAPVVPAAAAAAPMAAPAPQPHAIATPTFGAEELPREGAKSKMPLFIVIAAVLAIIVAAAVLMSRKSATPAAATNKPIATTAPAAPVTTSLPATTAPATTGTLVATGSAPSLDPAKVEEEVKKRLAAEKARLDQQAKSQQTAAATPPPAPAARPLPPPAAAVPQPVAPQPVAPQPQPAESRPAPQPVAPQPVAPQPVERPAPQAERAHEGELVPAGADGLTSPRMTRQAPVAYPPVARMQRVEGTVLLSVLISETGQVLDVKVIKGDSRLSGSAEQSVRRSSFAPGMKDGVRVRSWLPVGIAFKL